MDNISSRDYHLMNMASSVSHFSSWHTDSFHFCTPHGMFSVQAKFSFQFSVRSPCMFACAPLKKIRNQLINFSNCVKCKNCRHCCPNCLSFLINSILSLHLPLTQNPVSFLKSQFTTERATSPSHFCRTKLRN